MKKKAILFKSRYSIVCLEITQTCIFENKYTRRCTVYLLSKSATELFNCNITILIALMWDLNGIRQCCNQLIWSSKPPSWISTKAYCWVPKWNNTFKILLNCETPRFAVFRMNKIKYIKYGRFDALHHWQDFYSFTKSVGVFSH